MAVSRRGTKKVAAPGKKRTVKSAPTKKVTEPAPFVQTQDEAVSEEQVVKESNTAAIAEGGAPKKLGPAKKVSKVVSLHISIGDDDRERDIETFIEDMRNLLGAVKHGEKGVHVTAMGSYYIVDGKVCQPQDFDPKRENFKEGAKPPAWAGGPIRTQTVPKTSQGGRVGISARAYDEKYGPGGNPEVKAMLEEQRATHARLREESKKREAAEAAKSGKTVTRRGKKVAEPEPVEDWEDFDVEDIEDDEAMGNEAEEITAAAVRKIVKKKGAKKPQESASASKKPRKVVRRKK